MSLLRKLVVKLGDYQTRSNDEYGFNCPKCSRGNNKFHLGVNIKKRVFNCFRCKYAGHVAKLVGNVDNLPSVTIRSKIENKKKMSKIPYFKVLNPKDQNDVAKKCRKYLMSRLVPKSRWMQLQVGYCTEGKLTERLVIPMREDGAVVCWVARSLGQKEPKELGPSADSGWVRRSEIVYGIDDVTEGKTLTVTEGIFDAERVRSLGYQAVSILGSNLSEIQCGKILSKKPRQVVLMFDGDEAGVIGATKAFSMFMARRRNCCLRVLLPDGHDPANAPDGVIEKLLDRHYTAVV